MTEVTKPSKPVAPETVRLFEIIGFGQTNEEEYKNKVKNIMEVTGCEQEIAILTLHDCNDETEAIQRLLDSNTAPAQEGWFTKKKINKKKMISNPVENESLDAPKAYVTDGHSGDPVEGRRNVGSRERERRGSQKGSGESWDDDETTDTSKNEFRHDRSKPIRNGFSNNSPTYHERRDHDGEERQSSRIFLSKRNDRPHTDDHDRYSKERSSRDGQNIDRRNPRPYRERKPFRNGDDKDRPERNQWNKPKYNRDRDEVGEHELDDRQRERKFGKKGLYKRSDKDRIVFDSANGSSKTTPELNGDIYINSRESADAIDWDNPVLSNTDWGEEEVKKEFEDDVDEDKRIEALLSEGCVFHNSNYDQDNCDAEQTNIVSSSISTSPLPRETANSHPIFSPKTTSLSTPSASIPAPAPPHNQAAGVVFFQTGRMNLKRKIRSKIPEVPVELPNVDLDSFDIQFGSITLPVTQTDSQEDSKPTESPSPVDEEKTHLQESDLSPSNEQLPSPSAHKSTEQPPLPNSPPPKNDQPIPPRSPVSQDKQPSISDTSTSQQAPVPTPVTVPPHPQTHSQYHQHMNRQNERKAYSENSGKMHHQGGMSGNSVKLQQHPQIVPPVNSIDQPPGVPYLMAPMANVGGPNNLPPTTMSNLPRGPGKNFQTPVLYNPPGQYGMMPNYYWEQEMMRMMATQNNNPASNMVKEQNSNQVFQNNDAKFHEPTSPANPQTGMQGQSVYVPFHGYGFIPSMFPMMPKGNTYPNQVTAGGQTPYQTQPPLPPNIPTHPDQHSDYKANFANIQQKPGAMTQAADIQNMYKGYDQKSGIPFGFGYPFAQYVNPQMMPQQQPQYSSLNPNMLMQQPLDGQRPKW